MPPRSLKKIQVLSIFVLFLILAFLSGCIGSSGYSQPSPEGWYVDSDTFNEWIRFTDVTHGSANIHLNTDFFNGGVPNSINGYTEYRCYFMRMVGGSRNDIGSIYISNDDGADWVLEVIQYVPDSGLMVLSDGTRTVSFEYSSTPPSDNPDPDPDPDPDMGDIVLTNIEAYIVEDEETNWGIMDLVYVKFWVKNNDNVKHHIYWRVTRDPAPEYPHAGHIMDVGAGSTGYKWMFLGYRDISSLEGTIEIGYSTPEGCSISDSRCIHTITDSGRFLALPQ